jgi:hypothetical protein
VSTSKGEDYEDAESSDVDGSDSAWSRRYGTRDAAGMLPVRGLLRRVLRLLVEANQNKGGVGQWPTPLFVLTWLLISANIEI